MNYKSYKRSHTSSHTYIGPPAAPFCHSAPGPPMIQRNLTGLLPSYHVSRSTSSNVTRGKSRSRPGRIQTSSSTVFKSLQASSCHNIPYLSRTSTVTGWGAPLQNKDWPRGSSTTILINEPQICYTYV